MTTTAADRNRETYDRIWAHAVKRGYHPKGMRLASSPAAQARQLMASAQAQRTIHRIAGSLMLVAAALVGMSKAGHVEQNLRALDTPIDPDLLARIEQAVAPVKNQMWLQGRTENNDPHWIDPP